MLDELIRADQELLLKLNGGYRSEWADSVMWLFSQSTTWIPAAVVLLAVIIAVKRKESIYILLALGLTVLIADQVSSGLIKPLVERFRPTHEPALEGLVQTVNGYTGGKYGFVSSHAANSFGVALFCAMLFKNRLFGATMILWSLLDCYSRIYLGVHYPGDIVGGIIVGAAGAVVSYKLLERVRPQSLYLSRHSTTVDHKNGFNEHHALMLTVSMWVSMVVIAMLSI